MAEAATPDNNTEAARFIETHANDLARLSGLGGLNIRVGTKWATDLETGEVTVDPSFFETQGYEPEWCVYGTLHELMAHLKEAVTEPELTGRVQSFSKRGEAYHHLHNVVSDLAGNQAINKRFPILEAVCKDVYRQKMTPVADMRVERNGDPAPRHIQFLNAILRSGMLPDEETIVDEDVRAVIAGLRDYEDSGVDVLE